MNYLIQRHILSYFRRSFPKAFKSSQFHHIFSSDTTINLRNIAFPKHNTISSDDEKKYAYSTIKFTYDTVESKNNTTLTKNNTVIDEKCLTGIGIVSLNRPETLNAFNLQMWTEFHHIFKERISHDKNVKVVILTGGSPRAFSTGMDLNVFLEIDATLSEETCEARKKEGLNKIIQYLQDSVSATERCVVPVLATASGYCIGGALDVFLACDLRYCTTDTKFSIRETDLAMVADIGTLQRLPGIVGQQYARELAYTGREFNGKEAEKMGLVLKCYETYDEMMTAVTQTARVIASKSPLTIRGLKKTLLYARDHTVADSLEQVNMHNCASLHSNDLQQAMKAFAMKKKPIFKGV